MHLSTRPKLFSGLLLSFVFFFDTTIAFSVPTLKKHSPFVTYGSQIDIEEIKQAKNQSFDPFKLAQQDDFYVTDQDATTIQQIEIQKSEEKGEFGIWTARAILLLVAAIWGTNFASVKYLSTLCFHPPCNHPPSEAAFARFGVAALVSLPLLFRKNWEVVRSGLECGIFITIGYICQALALESISSGKAAFICSLTVITVPVISAILYGKPIKPAHVGAAIVALSGVAVLEGLVDVGALLGIHPAVADTGVSLAQTSTVANSALSSSSLETAATGPLAQVAQIMGISKGDLLALGQPIGFGFSFTRIEYYQNKFRDVPGSTATNAAAQCVMVGLLSFLWVLWDYHGVVPDFGYMIEPHRIAAVLWTGIVTTVLAIFLQGAALKTASATDAAITFSTEPVWASIFAFALLGEKMTTNLYIGGAVVLAACLVGALADIKKDEVATEDDSRSP